MELRSELTPNRYDHCKSFYRKAYVVKEENIEDYSVYRLDSYETPVCYAFKAPQNVVYVIKTWDGYSATTMRHIRSFIAKFGTTCKLLTVTNGVISPLDLSKKAWCALPVGNISDYQ